MVCKLDICKRIVIRPEVQYAISIEGYFYLAEILGQENGNLALGKGTEYQMKKPASISEEFSFKFIPFETITGLFIIEKDENINDITKILTS